MMIGSLHHLDRRSTCSRRPSPSPRRDPLETTIIAPVTVSGMDITFRRDMLGWIGATHFRLDPIDGPVPGMFAELRCTDTVRLHSGLAVPSPHFLVVTPGYLWPDYQVALDDEFADSLDIVVQSDAALLAIVTQRVPLNRSTVNLFSPIVVNCRTGSADQFVPTVNEVEAGWRVRTPVPSSLAPGSGREGGLPC
jgi:flagellar assembly factor FliW